MSQKQWIDMEKKQFELLKQIIQRLLPKKTIWAYGSRVTGSSDEKSDLDLVVFNCNKTQVADFRIALEESHLSFSVDVMDWNNIPNSFRQTIKEQYIVLQDKYQT